MLYFFGLALAVGLSIAIAAAGCGVGQGNVGQGAMAAMARQPDMAGQIRTGMIIALALIESLTIYALLIAFMVLGRLPTFEQLLQVAQAAGGR